MTRSAGKIPSPQRVNRFCYVQYCIMLDIILEEDCFLARVLPEPYLRPILYMERSISKELSLYRHETCPKVRVSFQDNWDTGFELTYFLLRSCCHTPSSVKSLNSHLLRSAVFFASRSWIPSPHWSFGRHSTLHLASLYFFFSLSPCQKNLDLK